MFGVYFLVIIWARKADMIDERKVNLIVYSLGRSYLFPFDCFCQMEVVPVLILDERNEEGKTNQISVSRCESEDFLL